MLGQCAQSVPLEVTLYGGEGGLSLGKRAAFIIEQGAIMKTKHIFKVYHILLTRIVLDASISERQKNVWGFVKARRQDNIGVHPLQHNDDIISDSPRKANVLNNYFFSIFTKENTSVMPSLDPALSSPDMGRITVTSSVVQKLLESLNVNKAGWFTYPYPKGAIIGDLDTTLPAILVPRWIT